MNVAKGKSNSDSERWQNSHLNADKIITNSEEGGLNLDAANLKAKRWEADIQDLTVTSRQDTEKYESKQTSASASGSVAYGSGGGGSVSAAYSKAKVDYAQVREQAGIQVGEEGMDVTVHHHTQLNGAIIDSEATQEKNRFKTQSISSTDIENRSEIKTESASISAGSGGINPMQALNTALSLLGNSHESDRSHTKSAISANIQVETETPENLTALSRDTKNANQQVTKQDLQKVQERQEMAKVIGEISNNAISIATYEEREKINKLGLEKFKLEEQKKALGDNDANRAQVAALDKQIDAIKGEIVLTQQKIDNNYGIGSPNGMAIRAVTAALQAAAQNDTNGAIVALASPYLNREIHKMTEGDTAKDKAANLAAHALLSAIEFQVTGKDPLTGAVAGVTGEATADIIARVYGKKPSELTANEKENISTLSQIAGGLAGALTAKANGTTGQQGGEFLTAVSGAETAKRAVENNYLSKEDWRSYEKAVKSCNSDEKCLDKVKKDFSEINKRNSLALKDACRLGGSLSECNSHTLAAKEGLDYARQNIPFEITSTWQANIMRASKRDSESKPTKALIGSEIINNIEILVANEKFRNDLKRDPEKLNKLITDIDQATLYVRTEKGNAYEFGAQFDYPNIGSLGGYQYFGRELALEPVYPEFLLVGGGMTKGATNGAKLLNSIISPSTKVTVGVNGVVSATAQYLADGEISPTQVLWDMTEAGITKNYNYKRFALWSAGSGFVEGYIKNGELNEGVSKSLSKLSTSSLGYFAGKKVEKYIDPMVNTYPKGFNQVSMGPNGMIKKYVDPSVMPTMYGNAVDSGLSKFIDYKLDHFRYYYNFEGNK